MSTRSIVLPDEVQALRGAEDQGAWLNAWDARTGRSGYFSGLLSRAPSGTHQAAREEPAAAVELEQEEEDEDQPGESGAADWVVRAMLHSYRRRVRAGQMQLVDADEERELQSSDISTCNVLAEFADLRILIEEVLSDVRPNSTAADRDRAVDSFYNWVAALGDDLLVVHYGNDTAKIAAASLTRLKSLERITSVPGSPPGSPMLGGSSSKPSRKGASRREKINYAVPFQELRYWAENAAGLFTEAGTLSQRGSSVSLGRGSSGPVLMRGSSGGLPRQMSVGEEVSL
jgi:hypothetical protein